MFRNLGALALAALMVVSSTAFAATNANQGALAQGKPANVKQAQSYSDKDHVLWLVGGGIVIGGILLVLTGTGHGAVGPTCPLTDCVTPTPTPTPTGGTP